MPHGTSNSCIQWHIDELIVERGSDRKLHTVTVEVFILLTTERFNKLNSLMFKFPIGNFLRFSFNHVSSYIL